MAELGDEVLEPNWDGYGALPIDKESAYWAAKLISALPEDIPKPEFGVDPDGEVSLDWYKNKRLVGIGISSAGVATLFVSEDISLGPAEPTYTFSLGDDDESNETILAALRKVYA